MTVAPSAAPASAVQLAAAVVVAVLHCATRANAINLTNTSPAASSSSSTAAECIPSGRCQVGSQPSIAAGLNIFTD
jgi:hypothetical protein